MSQEKNAGLLEAIIRNRAITAMKQSIAGDFKPVYDRLSQADWPRITVKQFGSNPVEILIPAHDVLALIQAAVGDALAQQTSDRAVKEFVARVDHLATEVESLRIEVSE